MYVVIDNYDSFTYNIVQYLSEMTSEHICVLRNDAVSVEELQAMDPKGIIISPGPGRPEDAGISLEVVKRLGPHIPILGICLGHQVIGEAFGGNVVQAKRIMHGKMDIIHHDGEGLFRYLPKDPSVIRYHSLCIDELTLPKVLEITARSSDGEIMGVRHTSYLIEGVQFHPESIASKQGKRILKNFLQYKRKVCDMTGILEKIMRGEDLERSEAAEVMDELTNGELSDAQIAAFLTALNMKGITEYEIAGCAQVLRDKRVPLWFDAPLLDTCGTGGDGLGTFNISSFTAIVCAACGVNVAKHGNRAVSSKCGSADFYRALGINIDLTPDQASSLLAATAFTFMFAPYYHGAMRYASPVRTSLKLKTIMNVLGPLVNPAGSAYQIIGVYDRTLLVKVAKAAKMLGVERVMTVHGMDGEDEISVTGSTEICYIDERGDLEMKVLSPADFGFPHYELSELSGGDAAENAAVAREICRGKCDKRYAAIRASILINSGAALYISRKVSDIASGIELADAALREGCVADTLERIISESQIIGEPSGGGV